MKTNEKILIALLGLGVAAIVVYNRTNITGVRVAPPGPAPFANVPPPNATAALFIENTRPWGNVPPVRPMMVRGASVMGLPTTNYGCTGANCGG